MIFPIWGKSDLNFFLNKLNEIQTFQADFYQITRTHQAVIAETSGRIVLKRPNQFYWSSEKIPKQFIIADGQRIYQYDPALEQVIIKQQGTLPRKTLAGLLTEKPFELKKYFDIKASKERLIFFPKNKADDASIKILFEKKQWLPKEICFSNQLRQMTVIRFSNVQVNRKIRSDYFKFTVPEGVDVVA